MWEPTYSEPLRSDDPGRPRAYVTMRDPVARGRTVERLEHAGWDVLVLASGAELLRAFAGLIEGTEPWMRPQLLVVDARARGCSGISIAAGLCDLGIELPIVLVTASGEPVPAPPAPSVRVVAAEDAAATVAALIATPADARHVADRASA